MTEQASETKSPSAAIPAGSWSREDAIALFGCHWRRTFGVNTDIEEKLGPIPAASSSPHAYPDLQSGIDALKADKARQQREVITVLEARQKSRGMRLATKLAHLLPDSMEGLRSIRDGRALLSALKQSREALAGLESWGPAVRRLPETIHLPVLLPIGQPVWEVSSHWLPTSPPGLRRYKVVAYEVQPLPKDAQSQWDYKVTYFAQGEPSGEGSRPDWRPTIQFSYPHEELARGQKLVTGKVQIAHHLYKDEALAKLRGLAEELRHSAEVAAMLADALQAEG